MILNNLSNNFAIYFSQNFFYPEVNERWLPHVRKLMLPYLTLEDYINSQIQSVTLPAVNMPAGDQQWGRYTLKKRIGKTMDEEMDKSLTITFKLTEGFTTYFILRQQMDLYYQFIKTKPLYWPSINVDIIDDSGHAMVTYEQEQITPESLSEINFSYAHKLGSYNTFTLEMKYNFFNIWYLDTVSQKMVLAAQNL